MSRSFKYVKMYSPPRKRLKVEDGGQFYTKAILSNELTEKPALKTVIISRVKHKQQISHFIRVLSEKIPLDTTLQHLKRVRQNEIIICKRSDIKEGETLKEYLSAVLESNIADHLCENVEEIDVPASVCKLRWQYDEMHSYWPSKFHPDKYLESLYDGSNFKNSDIEFQKCIVSFLLHLSKELESGRPCGLCVDPRTNSIVAIAGSHPESNPLYHAVMVLIDFVARTQSPCVLNERLSEDFVTSHTSSKVCEAGEFTLAGIPQKYYEFIVQNDTYKSFKLGAEPILLREKFKVNHEFEQGVDNLSKYGPYLCTGYDVYLTDEPCLMCSMALVHSRAKRVFFVRPSNGNGCLATNFKLQSVKELNHHYEVFQCFTPDAQS